METIINSLRNAADALALMEPNYAQHARSIYATARDLEGSQRLLNGFAPVEDEPAEDPSAVENGEGAHVA